MILDFPIDVQEMIYKKLEVYDRVRLKIALPKQHTLKFNDPALERKLGILVTALKKKRVTHLSNKMKIFLVSSVKKDDPTLNTITQNFPWDFVLKKTTEDYIIENNVDALRLCDSADFSNIQDMSVLYKMHPLTFHNLITQLPNFRTWLLKDRRMINSFVFNLFNYKNRKLLEFLRQDGHTALFGVDLTDAFVNCRSYIIKDDVLMSCRDSRRLILEHIKFDIDHLNHLWICRMNAMDIDGAIEVDAKLTDHN